MKKVKKQKTLLSPKLASLMRKGIDPRLAVKAGKK